MITDFLSSLRPRFWFHLVILAGAPGTTAWVSAGAYAGILTIITVTVVQFAGAALLGLDRRDRPQQARQ